MKEVAGASVQRPVSRAGWFHKYSWGLPPGPQGLKPACLAVLSSMAEAAPYPKPI